MRETSHPMNDGRDPSTGRVRESPHSPDEKTDFSMGRVTDRPHTTNDQTDSRKRRARETPKPTIRFKHGACKRDCPPADLRIKNRTLQSPTSMQVLTINLPKNPRLQEIGQHHHQSTEKGKTPLKTFLNRRREGKILFSFSFIGM